MEFSKTLKPLSGEKDWPIWKRKVRDLLEFYEGALDVVERKLSRPEPLESNATENQAREHKRKEDLYRKANSCAKSLITSTITDEIYQKVMDKDSACDMWDALYQQFEATSKDQLYKMCNDLFSFEWNENSDVSTHISKLKSLWMEINNGLRMKEEHTLPDLLLICKILNILPSSFEMFKSSWMMMTRDSDKSLDEIVMQLCLYERNFNKANNGSSSINQEALVLNQKKEIKGKQHYKFNKKNEDICHYCKKKGHWIKDCRKWLADGRPSKLKSTSSNQTNVALHLESCEVNVAEYSDDWWIDNGATKHVTNSSDYFANYVAFDEPHTILAAGKETLEALGKGTIQVMSKCNNQETKIELKDVWYVPSITRNLFSVLAAHDRNASSVFKSTTTECALRINGKIVLTGSRCLNGTLYKANVRTVKPDISVNSATACSSTLQLYHERWGHQDKHHVKDKLEKVMGIKVKYTNDICEPCVFSKACRLPFGRRETATSPGEVISTDVCGPFPPSFNGFKYLVVFKDDYTKYRYGFVVRNKSDVKDTLIQMLANAKTQGHTIKTLLSDNGGEFVNAEVKKILSKFGITQKLTAPYTPQQNGSAERDNRTIVEMARAFRFSNSDVLFPEALWAEFVKSAIYILNRTGKSSVAGVSPYELWCGKKPRIRHLRIIGSICYVHVPSQRRKKMDKKAVKGYLVGYDGDERYRIYIAADKRVEVSRDVKFSEKVADCHIDKRISNKENISPNTDVNDNEEITIRLKAKDEQNESIVEAANENNSDYSNSEDFEGFEDVEISEERVTDSESDDEESAVQDAEPHYRNKRQRDESDNNEDGPNVKRLRNRTILISNAVDGDCIMMSQEFVNQISTPTTFKEAFNSIQKDEWMKAMQSEINSLKENKTWILTDLPKGSKALPGKWVYKVKINPDGSIDKFKARLVIKGFKQKQGVDYDQTFSPVAKMSTIRSLLSVAATEGLHLSQFDVSTAFLYGELQETIYMNQPEGFNDGTKRVCLLNKSLYGLKQAPRCWHARMDKFLEKIGFKHSEADTCLYMREKNGKKLILALYVDDGLVAATDEKDLEEFLSDLKSQFKIVVKDATFFLGLEIEKNDNEIKIHQKAYATKILERFNFLECRPVTTPMEKASNEVKSGKLANEFPYRQAVGALMYLMLGTRPDLAYSVGYLSRSLENPTIEDVQKVKRVFRYIAGTLSFGIIYKRKGPRTLNCYSDADFGGCTTTGRSTSGVVVSYAGGAISWLSQRQPMVSTSTTEAEIVAANEAAKEVIWLKRLFKDIVNYNKVPVIQIDNTAALRLAQNPEFHKRTKHIALKHFFIREKVTEGNLSVSQVTTEYQVADMMTKPLHSGAERLFFADKGKFSKRLVGFQ